ncbi:DUF6922 domain-containing protein [Myroides indicus]|uniref:DUF6922 domain-containing protein n=1 Tax=Myroides indicus TaxID=1323422 RepID=A0A4R7ESF8_9FLAO|nr:hypothetical protein [Myroides indicus]TDS56531.1 hypothetical protein C8P70_12024 [Myroides indicus]
MRKQDNILDRIPSYVFWDTDVAKINAQIDYALIIARVLMFSDSSNYEENILLLEDIYSPETIIKVITFTKERIPDEVCALTSKRYSIPVKSKFSKYVYF